MRLYTHTFIHLINVSKGLVIGATGNRNVVSTSWCWNCLQYSWGDNGADPIWCPPWDHVGRRLTADLWDEGKLFRGNDSQVETWRPSKYRTIWLLSFYASSHVAFKICARWPPKTKGLELYVPQNGVLPSEMKIRKWTIWIVSFIAGHICAFVYVCFVYVCLTIERIIELSREVLYELSVAWITRGLLGNAGIRSWMLWQWGRAGYLGCWVCEWMRPPWSEKMAVEC